jgi:hypothetical protein
MVQFSRPLRRYLFIWAFNILATGMPLGVNIFIHSYGARRSRCSSRHRERIVYDLGISQPPRGVLIRRIVPSRRQAPQPVREAPGADFRPKWAIRVVAKKLAVTTSNVISGRFAIFFGSWCARMRLGFHLRRTSSVIALVVTVHRYFYTPKRQQGSPGH